MTDVMVNNVKLQAPPQVKTELIRMLVERYTRFACAITRYEEPPDWLCGYIEDSVVKAICSLGAESFASQSAAGVTTAYMDIQEDLRKSLKGKVNPLGAVTHERTGQETDIRTDP